VRLLSRGLPLAFNPQNADSTTAPSNQSLNVLQKAFAIEPKRSSVSLRSKCRNIDPVGGPLSVLHLG
jgi:hypothetical protein